MAAFIIVAEATDVPPGRGRTVRIGEREFALFNIDGEFFALDGQCPHRGGPLGAGITENSRVSCPLHGWEFDVKTGCCIDHPDRWADCFPARVVDGKVEICV